MCTQHSTVYKTVFCDVGTYTEYRRKRTRSTSLVGTALGNIVVEFKAC